MSARVPTRVTATDATVATAVPGSGSTDQSAPSPRLLDAVRTEWCKLRTLRSTWLVLGATVVVMALIGTVAAAAATGAETGGPPTVASDDPLVTVMTGTNFAVLLLGVLGCLTGAREHTSRMIVTTFVVAPRRWRTVAAKAVVLAAVVAPTSLASSLIAFLAGSAVLEARGGASLRLGDDGVIGSLLGMGLWLTAVSLVGLALGLLLRSTASSIGALVGVILVLPPILGALLPDSASAVLEALPSNAASAFTAVQATGEVGLSGAAGVAVVLGWVLALMGWAWHSTVRRDV